MAIPRPSGPPTVGGAPPAIPHDAVVQQKQGQATMIWAIGALVDPAFIRVVPDVDTLLQILYLRLGALSMPP